jgi:biopolymer transport protein ExbB/TolQ
MKLRLQVGHALATVIVLEVLYLSLRALLTPGVWVYEFIFHRSIIQWFTLALYVFTLVILVDRFVSHRREERALRGMGSSPRGTRPDSDFAAERFRRTDAALAKQSKREVADQTQMWLDEDRDSLNGAHSTIMDFVQVMLGLGFLGTIAGLDQSFFAALGAHGGGIDAVTNSMAQFAKGLATALDTTLLGLGCGMTVTLLSLLTRSREERLVDLLHEKVSRHIDQAIPAANRPDFVLPHREEAEPEAQAHPQPLLARVGSDVVTGRFLRWGFVPAVKGPRFLVKVPGRGGNVA